MCVCECVCVVGGGAAHLKSGPSSGRKSPGVCGATTMCLDAVAGCSRSSFRRNPAIRSVRGSGCQTWLRMCEINGFTAEATASQAGLGGQEIVVMVGTCLRFGDRRLR